MLKYNLKISFRQLLKNKIFSIINIAGLVIGIMSFIVILQYIRFELNYDNFHKDAENVFRVRNDYYKGAKLDEMTAACPPPLAPALKDNFSEVEEYVRLLRGIRMVISNEPENRNFRSDDIYFADSSFFSVFSFPVSKGQVENALNTPNSTIITESFAKKTFGNSNPVGKMLRFKSRYFDFTCTVSSVLKDIPANSHLRFDALVSMSTYRGEKKSYGTLSDWSSPMYFTYLKLKPKSDPKELEAKLPAYVENRWNNPADGEHFKFTLERLNSIHLNKNKVLSYEEETTGKQSIYLLLVIAFIIIIIAWVNYINLSTAKALDRAKEVGVRKVSGANKRNLIGQFFLESILFNAISFLITFACIAIFKNNITQLFGKSIDLNIFNDLSNILVILGLFIVGAVISGLYPAFVLSSYDPKNVLKGKLNRNNNSFSLKKALVVFQFAASIFLIAGALFVFKQVNYMRNKDLGLNADQLLTLRAPILSSDSLFMAKINSLKQEIKKYPEIRSIAGSYYIPGKEIRWKANIHKTINSSDPVYFSSFGGDVDFVPSFGFNLLYGRYFSDNLVTDKDAIIINKTGVEALGYKSAESIINQTVYMYGKRPKKVVGVIADYHHVSAKLKYEPICIQLSSQVMNYYTVNIHSSDISKTMGLIETLWKQKFPNDPFDYFFLDEYFNRQYKSDIQFGRIFTLFTCIAIFVACLGLFGLSYHTIRLRTKEIGIRKVNGARVLEVLILLNKDFVKWVALAFFLATPLTLLAIQKWLENYAYKTSLSLWIFVLAGGIAMCIALLTISLQSWKAASKNPIESLKYE